MSAAADGSDKLEEGARAARLRQVVMKSLEQTIKTVKYDKVAGCYPTLAEKYPKQLESALSQVSTYLIDSVMVKKEYEAILEERTAVAKLNELDELLEDAKRRKDSGEKATESPVLLPPEQLVRAQLLPLKREELANLEAKYKQEEEQNRESQNSVTKQANEIETLSASLKLALEDLDKAVQNATQISTQDLRHQVDDLLPLLKNPIALNHADLVG